MRQTDVKENRATIRKYIIDSFIKEDNAQLNDEFSFIEEGVIDSVGVLELVAFIEMSFHIRVEDEELVPNNLDSINKLVTYIESKIKKKLVSL